MNRIYLCIDLKTFYASVECVERGLDPFTTNLVVADANRTKGTICLAISPKLKALGIKNRCRLWEIPKNIHLIIAKPRMKLYMKYSAWIYSIYLKYVAKEDIHPYSIDEMFLDITHYLTLYNKGPIDIAKMIMDDIFKTTRITATTGIGTNLYLAKVALDIIAKHNANNIGYLDEEIYKEKLWHHLPITDFWRISYGIEARLHKLHLNDMYDIAHCDERLLYKEFGVDARFLIDHAWGIESCTIADIKAYKPKCSTLTSSQILCCDYKYQQARIVLIEMIDNMVLQLITKNLYTSHVSFFIGYSKNIIPPLKLSFKLEQATDNFKKIITRVLNDYDYCVNKNYMIKRIGICFSDIKERKYNQLDLFSSLENEDKDYKLEHVILNVKNKFGKNSLLRGTSYQEGATARERNKLIGGHNAE